jgi:hypothetical protein
MQSHHLVERSRQTPAYPAPPADSGERKVGPEPNVDGSEVLMGDCVPPSVEVFKFGLPSHIDPMVILDFVPELNAEAAEI